MQHIACTTLADLFKLFYIVIVFRMDETDTGQWGMAVSWKTDSFIYSIMTSVDDLTIDPGLYWGSVVNHPIDSMGTTGWFAVR